MQVAAPNPSPARTETHPVHRARGGRRPGPSDGTPTHFGESGRTVTIQVRPALATDRRGDRRLAQGLRSRMPRFLDHGVLPHDREPGAASAPSSRHRSRRGRWRDPRRPRRRAKNWSARGLAHAERPARDNARTRGRHCIVLVLSGCPDRRQRRQEQQIARRAAVGSAGDRCGNELTIH